MTSKPELHPIHPKLESIKTTSSDLALYADSETSLRIGGPSGSPAEVGGPAGVTGRLGERSG
jgi:hypothetical protein